MARFTYVKVGHKRYTLAAYLKLTGNWELYHKIRRRVYRQYSEIMSGDIVLAAEDQILKPDFKRAKCFPIFRVYILPEKAQVTFSTFCVYDPEFEVARINTQDMEVSYDKGKTWEAANKTYSRPLVRHKRRNTSCQQTSKCDGCSTVG